MATFKLHFRFKRWTFLSRENTSKDFLLFLRSYILQVILRVFARFSFNILIDWIWISITPFIHFCEYFTVIFILNWILFCNKWRIKEWRSNQKSLKVINFEPHNKFVSSFGWSLKNLYFKIWHSIVIIKILLSFEFKSWFLLESFGSTNHRYQILNKTVCSPNLNDQKQISNWQIIHIFKY